MRHALLIATALAFTLSTARADEPKKSEKEKTPPPAEDIFKPEEVTTAGSLDSVDYQATAGNLVVHPKGWDDVKDKENKDNPTAVASMFYVGYFKKGAAATARPITFFYNGGPGSSTVWLHMGAFGPKRVVTADDTHTPAAPYKVIDNQSSLLDVSDLVFIDAPGTGFSRIAGKEKEKTSTASTQTPMPSHNSSSSSSQNTAAGIRPNTYSVRATARRDPPCSSTCSSPTPRWISTASSCCRRF